MNLKKKMPFVIGWGILAVLLAVFFSKLPDILDVLRQLKWYWLVAAVAAQIGTYGSVAMIVNVFLRRFARPVRFSRLYKLAFSANYINQMIPSWGLASVFFWTHSLKKNGIPIDQGISVSVANVLLNLVSVFVLVVVGASYLVFKKALTDLQALAAVLVMGVVIAVFTMLLFLMSSRKRFEWFIGRLLAPVDVVMGLFTKRRMHNGDDEEVRTRLTTAYLTEELPKRFSELARDRRTLFLMIGSALAFYAFDVLTAYFLFLGFNYDIHGGVLLTGFAFTIIFAQLSLVPADVGVFEAAMTFVFAGLGVPFSTALLVALAFRALAYWVTIPLGVVVFREVTGKAA